MRSLEIENGKGIKAASGLVKIENTFYVIADDDVSLAEYNFSASQVKFVKLLNKNLSLDSKERKKQKPDWESLLHLNISEDHNLLLAIPSGSTDNRMIGAYVHLSNTGINEDLEIGSVDFSKLYSELKTQLSELNIEGVCVFQDKLKFFQRGNGLIGKNAIIDLDLAGFCDDLKNQIPIRASNILSITEYNLGHLNNHKLDFTDACVEGDKIWFLAVSEDSSSTYDDGEFKGAIIGCIDASGKELIRYEIDCATKPEGLWVEAEDNRLCFYVVTDADSSTIFASLYFGKLIQL